MQVKGKIKVIGDTIQVSEKFAKREIVVTTEEQYPQDILIQFNQEKCALLSSFKVGQAVNLSINLKGREWTSPQGEVKYFNTIEGWRIEPAGEVEAPEPSYEQNDGLPF
jgi:hypothetical protein